MKRSLSGMADLAVLSAEGVRLGAVHDAYVDPSEQRVVGFSIDWDEELLHAGSETDFLPLTQMVELTADVLSVGDELGESEGLAHDFSIDREGLLKVFEVLLGRRVHDADGALVGELADLHFDPQDGSLTDYEITQVHLDESPAPVKLLHARSGVDLLSDDGTLRLPAGAVLRDPSPRHPDESLEAPDPTLAIAFLEVDEEPVGEEDVESRRETFTQPEPY